MKFFQLIVSTTGEIICKDWYGEYDGWYQLVPSSVFSHTNPYKIFDFIINAISPIVDITDEIRICPITNIESLFNSRFTVGAVGSRDS